MNDMLKQMLSERAELILRRAGYSPLMSSEAKREGWWWLRARVGALAKRRGLYAGWAISWTNAGAGTVQVRPVEVRAAAHGEVTVAIEASAVSPGTERAQYLRLPSAQPKLPYTPGYSVAGRVVAKGPDVHDLEIGQAVAAVAVPHASVATIPAADVLAVPDGVALQDAATVMLGVISSNGVRRAAILPGQQVCVIGAGMVGLLAARLAAGRGSGRVTVVANSKRREALARAGGAEFHTADDERVQALEAPYVIEATGDPSAIHTAISAAAPGGRIVLLGSPRGLTADLPIAEIRRKRLTIAGAHVRNLAFESQREGIDSRRVEAGRYLDDLAAGRLSVTDLVDRSVDPREAEAFYRELASSAEITGATFDWRALDTDGWDVHRAQMARLPDVTGRGADANKRFLRPSRGADPVASLLAGYDPFAGATGSMSFALVGCGDIGVNNAGALANAPNARLAACFDPDAKLAAALAEPNGARVARQFEEVLDDRTIDAVFLSVPHHLHAPLAEQAAAAGKHVVVEKPPANDLAGARRMVEAAAASGVALSVCFPQRYQPDVVIGRRLVEEGLLGEIGGLSVQLIMDRSPAYRVGGFSGRSLSNWRDSREQAGGGVLIMNLSHHVDLVRHLTGQEPEEVSAFVAAVDRDAEVEDTISLTMRLPNGALGTMLGSVAARGARSTEVRLWGRHGHLVVESPEPRFYTLKAVEGLRTTRWQQLSNLPPVDTRAVYISRFVSAVTRGEPVDIGPEDALRVQAFIGAAYRSSMDGEPVRPDALLEEVA